MEAAKIVRLLGLLDRCVLVWPVSCVMRGFGAFYKRFMLYKRLPKLAGSAEGAGFDRK